MSNDNKEESGFAKSLLGAESEMEVIPKLLDEK